MFSLFREFLYIIIMLLHLLKTKGLMVEFGAKARPSAKFEGNNKLSRGSYFDGEMGFGSYIGANSIVKGKIGRFCSIADSVSFIDSTHPVSGYVSTHPAFYSMKKQSGFTFSKHQTFDEYPKLENSEYSIEVGNDVYIGYRATIIGPCRIGNGVVIAAGAVVTRDIPNYCIVGGVPAKIIRKRFSDDQIEFLNRFNWWDKDYKWLDEHVEEFNSLDEFIIKNREKGTYNE